MTPGEIIAASGLGLTAAGVIAGVMRWLMGAFGKLAVTLASVQAAGDATLAVAREALRKAQSAHARIDGEHREQDVIRGDVRVLATVVSERTGKRVDPLLSTGRFRPPQSGEENETS